MSNLQAELRNFICTECLSGEDGGQLRDDDELVLTGVLDSVALVKVVTHLEQVYALTLDAADISPDNFRSIEAIASFVKARLPPAPGFPEPAPPAAG